VSVLCKLCEEKEQSVARYREEHHKERERRRQLAGENELLRYENSRLRGALRSSLDSQVRVNRLYMATVAGRDVVVMAGGGGGDDGGG
jgi:hypothetical protein